MATKHACGLAVLCFASLVGDPGVQALGPTLAVVPTAHYKGGMLGVSATVAICRGTRSAAIALTGLPIAGRCVGKAYMSADGGVILTDPLSSRLTRRGVVVEAVDVGVGERQLWVRLRLPLGLGRVTMSLDRVEGAKVVA